MKFNDKQPTQLNQTPFDFDSIKKFWEKSEKIKRKKLGLLLLLLTMVGCLAVVFIQYLQKPEPLPKMLPVKININYPPHYLFSIYGVNQPMGVAVSQDGNRIYVTETGGESMVYLFDRDGNPLEAFYAMFLQPGERSPVYIEIGPDNNIYVTDRLQHSVFIFNSEGKYLEAIIGPALTMSEYVSKHSTQAISPETKISYSRFRESVTYKQEDGKIGKLPIPNLFDWAPLGIHCNSSGTLLITDVSDEAHLIRQMVLPSGWVAGSTTKDFDPFVQQFGAFGHESGQFMFPNMAISDSQGRIYVTDGNNSRISIWDDEGNYLENFGRGTGDAALGLPRGAAIDEEDRLFIVDAVNQTIKVFDVSGEQPVFLFNFGVAGTGDGQFNYPNDIAIDETGRLYITDRENNRVQVWSF